MKMVVRPTNDGGMQIDAKTASMRVHVAIQGDAQGTLRIVDENGRQVGTATATILDRAAIDLAEARRAGFVSVEDGEIQTQAIRRGGCCGAPME